MLVESANQFSLEELCRTQYSLKYFSKPCRPSDLWQNLNPVYSAVFLLVCSTAFFHHPPHFLGSPYGRYPECSKILQRKITPSLFAHFFWKVYKRTNILHEIHKQLCIQHAHSPILRMVRRTYIKDSNDQNVDSNAVELDFQLFICPHFPHQIVYLMNIYQPSNSKVLTNLGYLKLIVILQLLL